MGLLLLILAVNVLIATWNARVVGRVWDLASGFGLKTILICALVQSVVGYSSALVVGLGLGGYQLGLLDEEYLTVTIQLWYLLVIFPALGTGCIIWLHSVLMAVRNPSLGNFLGAGWNSYAMYRNVSGAIEAVPQAAEGVGKAFGKFFESKGDARGKIAILVVALSLGLGIILTYLVFAAGRRATAAELRYAGALEKAQSSY